MDPLNKLIQYFSEFPGIGPRQARRFAYFLMAKNPAYVDELSRLMTEVKKSVFTCTSCFRFFTSKNVLRESQPPLLCPICSDKSRDRSLLMVVARDVDLEAVEKSGIYSGLYFVLGGTIPILDSAPEHRVRLNELLDTISSRRPAEIILSLNANPEGEHTEEVLRARIQAAVHEELASSQSAEHTTYGKVSVLGRGLSTGTELEYSDADTIRNALKNRT